jgi:hypothetical protein
MNDLIPDYFNDNKPPKSGPEEFASKILIPLASLVFAVVTFVSTGGNRPPWATTVVIVFLAFVIAWILIKPIRSLGSRVVDWSGRRRFAKEMIPQLRELVHELNDLLSRDKVNTFSHLIPNLTSRLSENVKLIVRPDRNLREFQMLQSWADSLSTPFLLSKKADFWASAADLSVAVAQFAWACTYLRQDVNFIRSLEESTAGLLPELKPDWDAAIQKTSDFTSRFERFMKSVNAERFTNLCTTSFQEVKPL